MSSIYLGNKAFIYRWHHKDMPLIRQARIEKIEIIDGEVNEHFTLSEIG